MGSITVTNENCVPAERKYDWHFPGTIFNRNPSTTAHTSKIKDDDTYLDVFVVDVSEEVGAGEVEKVFS